MSQTIRNLHNHHYVNLKSHVSYLVRHERANRILFIYRVCCVNTDILKCVCELYYEFETLFLSCTILQHYRHTNLLKSEIRNNRWKRNGNWWEQGKVFRVEITPYQIGGGESVFILSLTRLQVQMGGNVKIYLKPVKHGDSDWIHLALERVQCYSLV